MSDIIVGNGIVQLDVQDTAKLKKVLFGGEPWLVYCVNADTENYRLPPVLEENARSLWRNLGLSVGVLKCWDPTSSGRSVAQRFKLNLKPPLSFVVANGNKPRMVGLTGISKVEDLEKKLRPAVALEIVKVDALKKTASNVLKPLHSSFRGLAMVTLDTSFWQLKLEEALMATRNKEKGGADVLCLLREERPGENTSLGGFFLESLDAGSAKVFLQKCQEQSGSVPLKATPKIKARPSKPKKVTPSPPRPRAPSPAKEAPKKAKAKGTVDQVGSRDTLESEEPLFEAVDEDEEEEEEEVEEDEVE
eukprot:CAMPEP_0114674062 /NCGR_PEP_ID=MMETSP0191-20121206/45726_1 /TAXON_ID=126664 /ORGANISM="Sorites sp." /LENGTH=304 /DNA_ID=CAMNT_0001940417 /DNA_START=33 /DNA_END=944 /DNA_ORIENTATION=+